MAEHETDVDFQFTSGLASDGRVLIDFQRPVDHLLFTPDQALEFAEELCERARESAHFRRHMIDPDFPRIIEMHGKKRNGS